MDNLTVRDSIIRTIVVSMDVLTVRDSINRASCIVVSIVMRHRLIIVSWDLSLAFHFKRIGIELQTVICPVFDFKGLVILIFQGIPHRMILT